MSDVSKVKELSEKIVSNAMDHYKLMKLSDDVELLKKCKSGMYEFLKYVYSGTSVVCIHWWLRDDGDKYFTGQFRQEAAWMLIGGTLPDQDGVKIRIPSIVKDLLPIDIFPDDLYIEWPHPKGNKFIPEGMIQKAVTEFHNQSS